MRDFPEPMETPAPRGSRRSVCWNIILSLLTVVLIYAKTATKGAGRVQIRHLLHYYFVSPIWSWKRCIIVDAAGSRTQRGWDGCRAACLHCRELVLQTDKPLRDQRLLVFQTELWQEKQKLHMPVGGDWDLTRLTPGWIREPEPCSTTLFWNRLLCTAEN